MVALKTNAETRDAAAGAVVAEHRERYGPPLTTPHPDVDISPRIVFADSSSGRTFDAYLDSLVPAHRPISRLGAWPN